MSNELLNKKQLEIMESMSNELLHKKLEAIESACDVKGRDYWDLILTNSESYIYTATPDFVIHTNDGYVITLKFMPMGYLNGYVNIPAYSHLASWVKDNASYDDMNHEISLPVELTYFNLSDLAFGWDHAHGWDANLYLSLTSQPTKTVSGPVQVLDEARNVIEKFREKDSLLKMELKQAQTDTIKEELMKTVCHPKRIAVWLAQGFEPF
jgi:hypothetical protein